jgi:hypothetical protein
MEAERQLYVTVEPDFGLKAFKKKKSLMKVIEVSPPN